jgi:pilus assembly protein Flp/PilA
MSQVLAFLRDEDGASAAEYALILAIIGAAIAVAMIFLGSTVANTVTRAGNCVATHTSAACS